MINAQHIAHMSGEEKQAELHRLATERYETERYTAPLSRDLGRNRRTVASWRGQNVPPDEVILLLLAWEREEAPSHAAASELVLAGRMMQRAAEHYGRAAEAIADAIKENA